VISRSTGKALLLASGSDGNARAQTAWSNAVGWATRAAWRGLPLRGAVGISVTFLLPATKRKRAMPTVKPDLDKLLRSTLDAMSGRAYHDDALIVAATARKDYAGKEGPGAWIEVTNLEPAAPARSDA
jgi:Holliday junction resolvase RusA-like endonuclease